MTLRVVEKLRALLVATRRSVAFARAEGLTFWQILGRGLQLIDRGPRGFVRRVIAYDSAKQTSAMVRESGLPTQGASGADQPSDYRHWLQLCEPVAPAVVDGVLISAVMPVCETPERFLREVIASVQGQRYAKWELCICDDFSSSPSVRAILDDARRADPRIKVVFNNSRSGISRTTNAALALATGAYVALVDHDDLLHPDALGAIAAAIAESGPDIVYTDHDCVDEAGERKLPYFKPDWSPDLFLAQMYLGHLVAIRRDLVLQAGGFDSALDGAQDYDLVLRCAARGATVKHVPRVLYHWRQHAGSTAGNADSKPYAHDAGRKAIQRYLDSRDTGARAADGLHTFCYDVRYPIAQGRKASIIVPTRDGLDLLRACVESLRSRTGFRNYELIVVDNGSVEAATTHWLEGMSRDGAIKVIRADIPFNWSRLNNMAARDAQGDVLVFLNNDVEIIDGDWLERLVEHALRPDIGVCGPLLLYGDMTIQHAGVVVGLGGWADHVFKGMPPVHMQANYVSPIMRRNVLAVTGACMAIEKRKFDDLGGFDESFVVCGSDVDLCLRAYRHGWLNVYIPEARLIHHESKTRDPRDIPEEDFAQSARSYAPFRVEGDPYYNPNLDTTSCLPRLRAIG